MSEFLLIIYAFIAISTAAILGWSAERGNMAEATLALLWCALWPLSIVFGLAKLVRDILSRRNA